MLNLDDDDPIEDSDEDAERDAGMREFLADLKKVGPFSKQILNYSYPPLLYQRGDYDEEDEDEDAEDADIKELIDRDNG